MAFSLGEISSTLGTAATVLKELNRLDLHEAIVKARAEIVQVRNDLIDKDEKIQQLEEALRRRPNLRLNHGAYYEWSPDRSAYDIEPYCSRCWEVDHRPVHLQLRWSEKKSVCPQCKGTIDSGQHGAPPKTAPDGSPIPEKPPA